MEEWAIQLPGWILQDGNYPDFRRGQRVEFAVEFWWVDGPRPSSGAQTPGHALTGDTYKVDAQMVTASDQALVIDIGIRAFQVRPPAEAASIEGIVEGTVGLGVDPFDYFERLAKDPKMPALVYSWEIVRIEWDTTPQFRVDNSSVRDPSRLSREDVYATDAWRDPKEVPDYVLHCQLLEVAPKRESSSTVNWINAHRTTR